VGPDTGLNSPAAIAVDPAGDVFVTTVFSPVTGYQNGSVLEFSPTANGDVAPVAILSGPNTGLTFYPQGLAVNGNRLFVTSGADTPTSSVLVYNLPLATAPGGNLADVAPSVTIMGPDTKLDGPIGLTFDPAGNLYVVNYSLTGNPADNSVTVYSPAQVAAGGDPAPIQDITGPNTGMVAPEFIVVTPCSTPPPPPGADCAVSRIAFQAAWVHAQDQVVKVVGTNPSDSRARCRVTLFVRRISPAKGPTAPDFPAAFRVGVAPGGTFTVFFGVTPPLAGTYRVTACARAVDASGTVVDTTPGNDCRSTTRTAA
jgi:hypothetical protein